MFDFQPTVHLSCIFLLSTDQGGESLLSPSDAGTSKTGSLSVLVERIVSVRFLLSTPRQIGKELLKEINMKYTITARDKGSHRDLCWHSGRRALLFLRKSETLFFIRGHLFCDVKDILQDGNATKVGPGRTLLSNFTRWESGRGRKRGRTVKQGREWWAKCGMRLQMMGALLPLGPIREQFLGTVTREVARTIATCFSVLSRSCWVLGCSAFPQPGLCLIKTQRCLIWGEFWGTVTSFPPTLYSYTWYK